MKLEKRNKEMLDVSPLYGGRRPNKFGAHMWMNKVL